MKMLLWRIQTTGVTIGKCQFWELYELLKQSQDTRRLANIINRLVNGSARGFNQPTNVSLDNKYTVLDISSLTGDMLAVGMFIGA